MLSINWRIKNKMNKENGLGKIVKEESLITCDNKNCEYSGEIFYCYLDQEKNCSIYLEYMNNNNKQNGT